MKKICSFFDDQKMPSINKETIEPKKEDGKPPYINSEQNISCIITDHQHLRNPPYFPSGIDISS